MAELYQSVYREMEEEKRRLKAAKIYRNSLEGARKNTMPRKLLAPAGVATASAQPVVDGTMGEAPAPADVTIQSIASILISRS